MKSTYGELLQKQEWQIFRKKVLKRDKSLCQLCSNSKFIKAGKLVFYTNHNNISNSIYVSSKENFNCGNFIVYRPEGVFIPMDGVLFLESYPSINKLIAFRHLTEQELCIKKQVHSLVSKTLSKQLGTAEKIMEFLMWRIFKEKSPMKFNESKFSEVSTEINLLYLKVEQELLKSRFEDWVFVSGLHVHHKRYILGKFPWEYDFEDLMTLCWSCHEETHQNSEISIYDSKGLLIEKNQACCRCHGAGIIPQFNHVENGICFRCHGACFEPSR